MSVGKTYILCCPTLKRELLAALGEEEDKVTNKKATATMKTGELSKPTDTMRADELSTPTVMYLPAGLHSDPKKLQRYVQEQIDQLTDAMRIIVCPSGCGGGTIGLRATHGELILPRTRDCLDILLSGKSLTTLQRPKHSIFLTADWADYMKQSTLDLDSLVKSKGREAAETFLRQIYKDFKDFYIIDTGTYNTKEVEEYIRPLVNVLDGRILSVKGTYGVLRKIARQQFDDDFLIVPRGGEVPPSYYTIDTDL